MSATRKIIFAAPAWWDLSEAVRAELKLTRSNLCVSSVVWTAEQLAISNRRVAAALATYRERERVRVEGVKKIG